MVRSLASNIDDYPHTGFTQYNDSFPKIPAVAISTKDAEWLSLELKKKMTVTAYFRTNCEMFPDAPSFNVVGEIRGSEFPAEIISVGGHLDSWDLAEGAHDDGTGIVQTIEILRALKAIGYKPRHTIRFVLFANEENGLRGGTKYAEETKAKNEKHIFALESDAGGFTPRSISFGGSDEQLKKAQSWVPLLLPYGVYEIEKGGGGADVAFGAGVRPLHRRSSAELCDGAPASSALADLWIRAAWISPVRSGVALDWRCE
jgi:Zn-dependent M28 family amino/carboxypeptidase